MKKISIILLMMSSFFMVNGSHDWTYKVTSSDSKDYYMWVPNVTSIRGILLTTVPNYMAGILGDTAIRRICKDQQLALVAAHNPSYKGEPNPVTSAMWNELQNGLKALAMQSGFPEVEFAPICTHGQSTEGIAAYRLAKYKPSRFFGVIMENATKLDNPTGLPGVPLIALRGSAEKTISAVGDDPWANTKSHILVRRDSGELANMILQPGAGHFGWYAFESQYTAMWLRKAAQYRIPSVISTTGETTLNSINEEDGWLSDTLFSPTIDVSSFADYVGTGKMSKYAFWHFDQEIANLWKTMHEVEFAKATSSISMTNYANNSPWSATNLANYTSTIDVVATITPASLTVTYQSFWNCLEFSGSVAKFSPCKVTPYGKTDWAVCIFQGDASYRATEQAKWVKVTPNPTSTAFVYSDITDKEADAVPFAYGATFSGNAASSYIIAGAITSSGSNLQPDVFPKGISTAIVNYCYQGNLASPAETFAVTFKSGVFPAASNFSDSLSIPTLQPALLAEVPKIGIYPNPAIDEISFNIAVLSSTINYHIIDISGGIVSKGALPSDSPRINVSVLKSGVYFLVLNDSLKSYSFKFIKK